MHDDLAMVHGYNLSKHVAMLMQDNIFFSGTEQKPYSGCNAKRLSLTDESTVLLYFSFYEEQFHAFPEISEKIVINFRDPKNLIETQFSQYDFSINHVNLNDYEFEYKGFRFLF